MKRGIALFWLCLLLFSLVGCNQTTVNLPRRLTADDVTLYFGGSGFAMGGLDAKTVQELTRLFSRLRLQDTDREIDMATMLSIRFWNNGQLEATFSVDHNGVFWLEGDARCYVAPSFDYARVLEIYRNLAAPVTPPLPLPQPLPRPEYPLDELPELLESPPTYEWPENLIDIGQELCPDWWGDLEGQLISENRIIVRGSRGTVVYSFGLQKEINRLAQRIYPMGDNYYYSSNPLCLFGKDFMMLAQYKPPYPALPGIDGRTVVHTQGIVLENVNNRDRKTLDLKAVYDYDGQAWVTAFDGENIFFTATCDPLGGGDAVGFFNIRNGGSMLYPIENFPGVPVAVGGGKALFWQNGTNGYNGTTCLMMDTATRTVTVAKPSSPVCALSPNGMYLLSMTSGNIWQEEPATVRFTIYDAATMTPLHQEDLGIPILSTNNAMIQNISISNSGKMICFSGKLWEPGHGESAGDGGGESQEQEDDSGQWASVYVYTIGVKGSAAESAAESTATSHGESTVENTAMSHGESTVDNTAASHGESVVENTAINHEGGAPESAES